jgi:membrane protein implicated in regulation of membrane protease activity
MCHLIFFLPIFGLPIFWLLPFNTALAAYVVICAISVLLYYKVFQALHSRVCTGKEAMLGKTAVVIRNIDPEGKIQFATEIWNATAKGKVFLEGQKVMIKGVMGLNLLVAEVPAEKRGIALLTTR